MNKKKLIAIAAVLVAAMIAGGVAAWLSDGDTATNEITTGDVKIHLTEAGWEGMTGKNVKPNAVLPKDPRVTNTGSNPAYVFVRVEMAALPEGTQVHSGTSISRSGRGVPLFTTKTASGLAYDNVNWTLLTRSIANGRIAQVYAYAKNNVMTALNHGETTTAVFDKVRLANVVSTEPLKSLNPNIIVTAYGIQTTELGAKGTTAPLEVWNIVTNYQLSR